MSQYSIYIVPGAWQEIKKLPGNVRHRVAQAVDDLANNPRPPGSKQLDAPDLEPDLFRLRLDRWRIVYAVSEEDRAIDILAVRKRPPYDYGDIDALIAALR